MTLADGSSRVAIARRTSPDAAASPEGRYSIVTCRLGGSELCQVIVDDFPARNS
jgi:hypothetical protein